MKSQGKKGTIRDVMTRDPACCATDTPLTDVVKAMIENDCGELPVIDRDRRPIGVVTDRDICVRTIGRNENPLEKTAGECMTSPAITVRERDSLREACDKLEGNQIRRVVVVDDDGVCIGIVSQADIARKAGPGATAEVVRAVSGPPAS